MNEAIRLMQKGFRASVAADVLDACDTAEGIRDAVRNGEPGKFGLAPHEYSELVTQAERAFNALFAARVLLEEKP